MLVAICRDHKVRVWNLSSFDCILCTDLVQYLAEAGREMHQGTQHHKVAAVKQVRGCLFLQFFFLFQPKNFFSFLRCVRLGVIFIVNLRLQPI